MKKKKYPEGGEIKPRLSVQSTSVNIKHPLTDLNLVDEMIKRGYHTDRNALINMSPEQRFSLIPTGTDLSWEKVKKGTANKGNYKIYQTVPHNRGTDVFQDGKLLMRNPNQAYLESMGLSKKYGKGGKIGLDMDQLYQQYGLGGWLKENAGGLLQTVGGGLATAVGTGLIGTGIGAPIGAALTSAGVGMLSSGIGTIAGNAAADDPEVIDYSKDIRMPRTVGKENMTANVMSFAKGGSLKGISRNKAKEMLDNPPHGKKLTAKQKKTFNAISHGWKPSYADGGNLMQLEGPNHAEGGIQFLPDAELEGGETVYNDVVNSDRIKITKKIADQYGLPKGAVGKTVADYSKDIDKKYKGREGDSISMTTKELELNNIAKMSKDLAPKRNTGNKYAYGDEEPLNTSKFPLYYNQFMQGTNDLANFIGEPLMGNKFTNQPYKVPDIGSSGDRNVNVFGTAIMPFSTYPFGRKDNSPQYTDPSYYTTGAGNPESSVGPVNIRQNPQPNINSTPFSEGQLLDIRDPQKINMTGNPWNAFNVPKVGTFNPATGDADKLRPNKITVPDITTAVSNKPNFEGIGMDLLGAVPIGVSAFMAAKTAKEGYDTVKLPRVHAENFNPAFIDPRYQLDQVSDSFNTANEGMEQVSKKDYLRRRIQSATEEGKARSGVLGQVSAANTQMLNQSRMLNKQSRERADQTNLYTSMQEEQINAANKGAWQTAKDYQLSNLGTMAGEFARDIRLEKANDQYNERMFNTMENMYPGLSFNPTTGQWMNTSAGALMPDTSSINTSAAYKGWQYTQGSNVYDNPALGVGINPYSNFVNSAVGGRSNRNNYGPYSLPAVNLNRPYR